MSKKKLKSVKCYVAAIGNEQMDFDLLKTYSPDKTTKEMLENQTCEDGDVVWEITMKPIKKVSLSKTTLVNL